MRLRILPITVDSEVAIKKHFERIRVSSFEIDEFVARMYAFKRRLDMNLRVSIEPSEEGGFTATVKSLPGCISEGETRDEALTNIREAIALYLDPVDDDTAGMPNAEQLEVAV